MHETRGLRLPKPVHAASFASWEDSLQLKRMHINGRKKERLLFTVNRSLSVVVQCASSAFLAAPKLLRKAE